MMLMWMFVGLVFSLGSTVTAHAQTQDPLDCSPQEFLEAQRAIPRHLNIFYKPLLAQDFGEIRNAITNENSVRWHVNCILYDKACTSLGKAMQYFVTSQSGGHACKSCQAACLQRRLRTVLHEIYCSYPAISEEIREYYLVKDKIDIIRYYLGSNPVC